MLKFVSFTSNPGYCNFGTIVDGVGIGRPQSVAIGKGYTIVCTGSYDGPVEPLSPGAKLDLQYRNGWLKLSHSTRCDADNSDGTAQASTAHLLSTNRCCTPPVWTSVAIILLIHHENYYVYRSSGLGTNTCAFVHLHKGPVSTQMKMGLFNDLALFLVMRENRIVQPMKKNR